MRVFRLVLVGLIALLTACTGPGLMTGDSGPPANAIRISIAYSPEKEKWLSEQITRFNQRRIEVDNRPVFVEGINKSSGVARTEIKNGALNVTVWSPSASTWLEVLKLESGNPNVAVSSNPLALTPVVIAMWRPMAEAMGWPNIRAIVLLSDGADNASTISLQELRQRFDETGISIFPVAYGADADATILENIAEFSRTIVVKGDTGDIAQIFENLSRYF